MAAVAIEYLDDPFENERAVMLGSSLREARQALQKLRVLSFQVFLQGAPIEQICDPIEDVLSSCGRAIEELEARREPRTRSQIKELLRA